MNNWKKSAYKKFDERESSGVFGLTPDYFMTDGIPVRAMPLNNDAGPSVLPGTTWNCSNDITAQYGEFSCYTFTLSQILVVTCFSKFNFDH